MSRHVAKTRFKTSLKLVASWLCVTSFAEVSLAANFSMTYSGRLTQQTGAPLDGPVDITVKFWTSARSGNTVGTPIDFTDVTLNQGVFTLPLELTPAQISAIFGDGTDPVFIEVTAAGKTYPRQHYTYVPLALRVPVDAKTLAFDADGKLGLSLTSLPSANQFLTKDSNGRLSWGSPAVTTLQGQTIAAATPSSGQVLTFNGGQWVPTTLTSSGSGSVSSSGMQPAGNYLTALTGDVVATGPGSSTAILASVALPGTATKITFDAKGRVTSGTSLTSSDITTALGYAPLNKDGSTPLTGNWAVGGKDITGVGNLALSSNSTFALGAYTTDPTSLTAIDAGKMWYNSGSLKFWNGSAVQTLGVMGSGSAGTFTKLTTNAQGQVTSGTTLANSDIPDLDANKITSGQLGVARGGTGLASGNAGGIPYFSDPNTLASSSPFALNGIVLGGGSNGAPTSTAALSNGQLLIGSTGTTPVPASLSSGANAGVTITNGPGSITLDTAQDIRPTASPTFATVDAATLASATYVVGTADNSATPTAGMLRAANAVGSDAVGANLVLAGGNGTGTGGSGSIQFNTAAADATGASANTLATRMTIMPSGNVGIGTTAPISFLHAAGSTPFYVDRAFDDANASGIIARKARGSISAPTAVMQGDDLGKFHTFGYDGSNYVQVSSIITTASGTVSPGIVPADMIFRLYPAGSPVERFRITASGNVGIGTSSPAQKLDVAGVIRSSSGGIMFPDGSIMTSALPTPAAGYNSTTDLNLAADSGGNGTGNISVSTKGTERVRITNSGNIGIGTTAPGYQLTLAGNGLAFGVDNAAYFAAKNSTGTYENYLWPRWSDNVMYLNYGSAGFNIRNNSSVSTMFMANAGNVGIGTTTPLSKLDINGAAAIGSYAGTTSAPTNSLIVSGNIGVGTSAPSQPLEVAGMIKSSSGGFMFPDGSVMTTAASTGSNGSSSTTDLNLNSDSGAAGSGDIMLSTRGAERMRIANSGNVGIGTSNPADKLFVWSTKESTVTPQTPGLAVGDASLANTGVGGGIAFWGNYTGTTPIAGATIHAMKNNATAGDTGFNLAFNTRPNAGKPTERMRITGTGNVGIGTTAPVALLDVQSTLGGVLDAQHLTSSSTTAMETVRIGESITSSSYQNTLNLWYNNSASTTVTGPIVQNQGAVSTGQNVSNGLLLQVQNSSAPLVIATGGWPGSEKMRVTSNGNVGIGTTAPSTKLAVAGSGSFTGNVGIGTTVPTQALEVTGTIKSTTGGIMFPDGTVMTSAASPSTGSSSITDLNLGADIGAAGSGVLSFSTAGSERMRVANNGNVGIGSTSPAAKLDVEGTGGVILNAGNVGIGTTSPTPGNVLEVIGAIATNNTGYGGLWLSTTRTSGFGDFGASQGINFRSGNIDNRMVLNSSGNLGIGIGTVTPASRLDVANGTGSSLIYPLTLRNGAASTTANTGTGLAFSLTTGATHHAEINTVVSNTGTGASDLYFTTYDGSSVTEKMRIQAGGSVGIGTTTPFNKLSVAGSADFTGNVGIGSNIPTQALDVAGVIRSSTGGIMFPDGSVMTSAATPGTGTSSTGDLTFAADSGLTGTGVITFAARGSEKMRITNGGNIGFGTAGPLSKVDVAGGMAVGSYAGATAAPTNGLIVSGNVGIGTTVPSSILDVRGNVLTNSTYGFSSISSVTPTATIYINAPATNTLAFANASTERMRIDASGNVGIGTTSVGSKLQVNGNAAIGYSTSTAGPTNGLAVSGKVGIGTTAPGQMLEVAGTIRSTSGGIMFPDGTVMTTASGGTSSGTTSVTDLAFASGTGTSSSGVITLATHNLERMRVDYNGNVGIGAAAPVNKLDVAGGVAIGATYAGGTTAPSNGLIVQGNVGIGTTAPATALEVNGPIANNTVGVSDVLTLHRLGGSSVSWDQWAAFSLGRYVANGGSPYYPNSRLDIKLNDTSTTAAESNVSTVMTLQANGNVGIATTAPANKLAVWGTGNTLRIGNDASADATAADFSIVNSTNVPKIKLTKSGVASAYMSVSSSGLVFNTDTVNNIDFRTGASASTTTAESSGTSRLFISSTGNVGIGTTSPAQKLDVAGAIRSTSGGFIFPDGTAMTTAITATTAGSSSTEDLNFAADSDASGAGAIVVSTNGVERIRVLNSGNVGIGTAVPKSTLDIAGGVSVGTYGGVNAAPTNGLIVSGNVGIGTTAPGSLLQVNGSAAVGYSAATAAPTNGLAVSGNVGIATTAPANKLAVWGTGNTLRIGNDASADATAADFSIVNSTNVPKIKLTKSGVASAYMSVSSSGLVFNTDTVNNIDFRTGASASTTTAESSGTSRLFISSTGNVGIGTTSPTQRLQVGTSGDGTVALANAWNTFSDIRLKRDLAVIPDALDKLLELHGYYYFWKDGSDQTRQVGVVAQEVEKILPELVRTGSDGIKTVDYPKLTAVLIEGTKQLKARVDAAEAESAQLKARADAAEAESALLKAESAQLKQALCSKFPDLDLCFR